MQPTQSNAMTRSSLRTIWILSSVLLSVAGIVLFRQAQSLQTELEMLNVDIDAKQRELDNAERLSAALAQVDGLTINEDNATRLEILRHLGLEQNNYQLEISGQSQDQVGTTMLFSRSITIRADNLPYNQALNLADKLYNSGKFNLQRVQVTPSAEVENLVNLLLEGRIYGLRKTEPIR